MSYLEQGILLLNSQSIFPITNTVKYKIVLMRTINTVLRRHISECSLFACVINFSTRNEWSTSRLGALHLEKDALVPIEFETGLTQGRVWT